MKKGNSWFKLLGSLAVLRVCSSVNPQVFQYNLSPSNSFENRWVLQADSSSHGWSWAGLWWAV